MTGEDKKNGCGSLLLGIILTLGVIAIGFVGCVGMIGYNINKNEEESAGKAVINDTSWVPKGFVAYNNKVATKWSEKGSYSCSYGQRCVQMEVIPKEGCDSLYVELTQHDANGNNVGYTNETTSNIGSGEKAILLFNMFGDFNSVKLSKISCY